MLSSILPKSKNSPDIGTTRTGPARRLVLRWILALILAVPLASLGVTPNGTDRATVGMLKYDVAFLKSALAGEAMALRGGGSGRQGGGGQ